MYLLRRRRHQQAARRRPDTVIEATPGDALQFEERVRPLADSEAIRWLVAANKYLSHQLSLSGASQMPAVVAMRAGMHGIELLLDEPCTPVEGFGATGDLAWQLDPGIEIELMEAQAADAHPYCPGLLPAGETDSGDLLIDFEQLAVVSVAGDSDTIVGWLRSLAVGVTSVAWSQDCEVVAIGVDDTLEAIDQVTIPDDPLVWAEHTVAAMQATADRLVGSSYEQRVRPGEIHHPMIVLVGPGYEGVAELLAKAGGLAHSPMAVVAAAPLVDASRIEMHSDSASLEPNGVDFKPTVTTSEAVHWTAELLAAASHTITIPTGQLLDDIEPATGETQDGGGDDEDSSAPSDDQQPIVLSDGGSPDRASQVPSTEVAEQIQAIVSRRPVEVRVLAAEPHVGGLEDRPSAKIEAVMVYLAFQRSVSSERVREVFWPASVNRSTSDNAMAKVRRCLGSASDGESRLSLATNSGRYVVSDDVGCDWHRVTQLVALSRSTRNDVDRVALLETALQQVTGKPGDEAPAKHYGWLRDDYQVYTEIETALVDAAHRLGELALADGHTSRARWAANQGLMVVPGQEALLRIQMRAASLAGDAQGVEAAYRCATASAEALSPWEEVQPETEEVYATATRRVPVGGSSTSDRGH